MMLFRSIGFSRHLPFNGNWEFTSEVFKEFKEKVMMMHGFPFIPFRDLQISTINSIACHLPSTCFLRTFHTLPKEQLALKILDTWKPEIAYEFAEITYDIIPGFVSHGNFMFDSQFPWLTQKPGDKSWETALMDSTTVSWFSSPVTSKRLRNTKRGTVHTTVIYNQSKIQKSNVQTPDMTSHYAGLFKEIPSIKHWLIIIPCISE